ncbi:MAG: mobilization protein, partial [Faecousia sp.]
HRSYERQGVDLLPTVHEGSTVRAMERKRISTEKGEFNRWVKATNAAIRDIRRKIAALVEWLKEVEGELSKPKSPDLISLLQAYFDRRNAGAYSQKAKINNLKEMNALFNYLMENGIHDLDTLENRVDTLRDFSDSLKTKLDSQTARMKEIRKLPDYLAAYHEMKPVYDGLHKIKFTRSKEKYKADHAAELKQFYEARRKLSAQFPDGKFDRQKLDAEYARLEQEHAETYAQFKSIRENSQQLWKIKSHVESARKNQEQAQQQNHRKQEQEI